MAPASDEPPALPPALEELLQTLDAAPAITRDLFQYALAILMAQDGQAQLIVRHVAGDCEYLTYLTATGDTFSVTRPGVSEELLDELVRQVRYVLEESHRGQSGGEAA